MPTWCNKVILLMYSYLNMFRVHTPIIKNIRCWVAAYGFVHRIFGLVVVLRAAAWFVWTVRMVPCGTIRTLLHQVLAFHIISWGRCKVKQPSSLTIGHMLYISQGQTPWLCCAGNGLNPTDCTCLINVSLFPLYKHRHIDCISDVGINQYQ